jgi:hypothetical protein
MDTGFCHRPPNIALSGKNPGGDIFVTNKQPHINTLCLGHHHVVTCVLILLPVKLAAASTDLTKS